MDRPTSWLDRIDIAAPCPASWAEMSGDERRRFCAECKLHVYDLSAMTREEAEALVAGSEGKGDRLCVRFFRRADGTVLTRDCPVGLRKRIANVWARCAAVAGMLLAGLTGCARKPAPPQGGGETPPEHVQPLMGEVCVEPAPGTVELMGDVALPPETLGRIAPPPQPGNEPGGTPQERDR